MPASQYCKCPIDAIEKRLNLYRDFIMNTGSLDLKEMAREELRDEKKYKKTVLYNHEVACLGRVHLLLRNN